MIPLKPTHKSVGKEKKNKLKKRRSCLEDIFPDRKQDTDV